MKPLKLILTGFAGIFSGRGKKTVELDLTQVPSDAQIVALVGPNGSSKTTLMDNMHPYRVMPSRLNTTTSTPNPGSFSFYDQITGEEASKDLYWQHMGKTYRSLINIHVTPKTQKQEAYLFVQKDDQYIPYTNQSGLASDGKTATYDACVNEILGSPENFFMTQFSAQGKRQIGAHKSSEIKDVLAEMFGTQDMKLLSQQAIDVTKAMKNSLVALQSNAIQHQAKALKFNEFALSKQNVEAEIAEHEVRLAAIEDEQSTCSLALRKHEDQMASQTSLIARRESIQSRIDTANQSWVEHQKQVDLRNQAGLNEFDERLSHDKTSLQQIQASINSITGRITSAQMQLQGYEDTKELANSKPGLMQKKSDLLTRIEDLRIKVKPLADLRLKANQFLTSLTETRTSGKNLADAINIAKGVAALIDEVPCKGTNLQGKCMLLADANTASKSIPVQITSKDELLKKYQKTNDSYKVTISVITQLEASDAELRKIESDLHECEAALLKSLQAIKSLEQLNLLKDELPNLQSECNTLQANLNKVQALVTESENKRKDLVAQQASDMHIAKKAFDDRLNDLSTELNSLPPLVTMEDIEAIKAKVNELSLKRSELNAAIVKLNEKLTEANRNLFEANIAKAELLKLSKVTAIMSDEISVYSLTAKAFGNDGILALSIDDAGPGISKIANNLLEDCYEGRFSVRMETQKPTSTGVLKETFEVMVEDTHRGESKTLNAMSGGEKVWVNECLVRAFALYKTQTSGHTFQTLFCDESDGALDPERKRQFIAMKRAVLKIGGYEREYMITQTPELWDAADYVIDVTKL